MEELAAAVWRDRRLLHERRVDVWIEPHLARRRTGVAHPVEDFLFTYYSFRPAALRRWHPGYGVTLLDAREYAEQPGYRVSNGAATVDTALLARRRPLVERTRALLTATASRPPSLGCLGLHEWAMVYRLPHDEVRHSAWPLRLGATGTDTVVEEHRIGCTHFDAYRFFTDPARRLNRVRPGRDDRADFEQPGCLHAGMDLYKHSFRLSPLVGSDLVADCFELAREIRELDMRASPYDLAALGYEPVRIETAEGKQEYIDAQRRFAERGHPLRQRLIDECGRLLKQDR